MNKRLDNFYIRDLPVLLTKETVPAAFYPLIPFREDIVKTLTAWGIEDKYQYLALLQAEPKQRFFSEPEMERVFLRLLALHDYRERSLMELGLADTRFLTKLALGGFRKSSSFLLLCSDIGVKQVAERFEGEAEIVEKMYCLCDLMRLPGVKHIRSELYYSCGYRRMKDFAAAEPEQIRQDMIRGIEAQQLVCSVPLMKELRSQAAAARILPEL